MPYKDLETTLYCIQFTNMLVSNLMMVLFVMPFPITTAASGEWLFGRPYIQTENERLSVHGFHVCDRRSRVVIF